MSGVFTMPYVIPLMLGMTYDARTSTPGLNIFNKSYVDEPVVQSFRSVSTSYKVLSEVSDIKDTLQIAADLSLKLKSGAISVDGKGLYIKTKNTASSDIEILTRLFYKSTVKVLSPDAAPVYGWNKYTPDQLGTHYVSGITYGAELIASIRCIVFNEEDKENITGEIQLAFEQSSVHLSLGGKLDMFEANIKKKARTEVSYYGNVPLKEIPNSVQGLKKLITSFKPQLEEIGLGDGIPISVDLAPLSNLDYAAEDAKKFQFARNKALEDEFGQLEEHLDELQTARHDLMELARNVPYDLDENEFEKVGHLMHRINNVISAYYEVLWGLDISGSRDQLEVAYQAYKEDDAELTYYKFRRLVIGVAKELSNRDSSSKLTGDAFVQWGSNICTGQGVKTLYSGITAGSVAGIGGSYKYICVPDYLNESYPLDQSIPVSSPIDGIKFAVLRNGPAPYSGLDGAQLSGLSVSCAQCFSPDSSVVTIMPGYSECPASGIMLYTGHYMTAVDNVGHVSQYICVDKEPTKPTDANETLCETIVEGSNNIFPITYVDNEAVKCIACGIRSTSALF